MIKRLAAFAAFAALPLLLVACQKDQKATLETAPPPPMPTDDPFATGDETGFEQDTSASMPPPESGAQPEEEVTFTQSPQASAAFGGNRAHTIRKGDTMWSLAVRYYGDGQRWIEIARANPGVDPKKMYVGTEIVIP